MSLRVGIDTVLIASVQEALDAHGERYLRRVYTEREVADAGAEPARLAARFAAKEAALKALRPADEAVPWTDVEIVRAPGGWVEVALHGAAARLAERDGVHGLTASLTHEGAYASAVVAAQT